MDGDNDIRQPDWGPFGRPLFDDPKARALSRVGVVDVGSNSVRLVVFDGAARSPAYFYNEKIMCGLGIGMRETGLLNPEGRKRAISALKRFQLVAEGMKITPLTAVATAAVREAEDGPEFVKEVEDLIGLPLFVIDGREEARLSAQGVLLGWPGAEGIVSDIGGSSMELAQLTGGAVGERLTSSLGPQVLAGVKGGKKGRRAFIRQRIESMAERLEVKGKRLFLVGGSWRAFARIDMARNQYPLTVQHEYRMTTKSALETAKFILNHEPSEVASLSGVSSNRMSMVPLATEVLAQLIRMMSPREIAISAYGIREGMLYQQMPEELRARDPLIEACRFAEAKDARLPGFGRTLYGFVQPLFRTAPPTRQRIYKAACLLHDVSWRAHPDYRAEVCFDNATRANLGGLTHEERVFLGVSLLHRYKNSRQGSPFTPLFSLLNEKQLHEAEVLGKAMRLGAMFSVQMPELMGELRWFPKKKRLEMWLPERTRALFGEVAKARFQSLASTLDAETAVHVRRESAR
ncbi:MAG: Ppx/GppA family phosphatase [Pseudomonadota bacterium]